MIKHLRKPLSLIIALTTAGCLSVEAGLLDSYQKAFTIEVGAFYPVISSEVSLNGPNGRGTVIDIEDDLDFSDREGIFEVTASWRFSNKWSLQSDYVDLARTSYGTLQREISWGDRTLEVDTDFASRFDVMVARLGLTYEWLQKENWNFGVTLGIHMSEISAALAKVESSSSRALFDEGAKASTGGIFPLPNIGMIYRYMISDNWLLSTRLDVFVIQIEDFAGELYSGEVNVRYLFGEEARWGLGIGYKFFSLDMEYDSSSWDGSANITYHGPKVFTSVSW
jgi:hypothetical protein